MWGKSQVICHPDVSVGTNKERRRVSNCVRRSGSAAASRLDEKQSGRPVCFGCLTQWGQGANGGGECEGRVVGGGSTTQLASARGQNVQILGDKKNMCCLLFQLRIIGNLMLV